LTRFVHVTANTTADNACLKQGLGRSVCSHISLPILGVDFKGLFVDLERCTDWLVFSYWKKHAKTIHTYAIAVMCRAKACSYEIHRKKFRIAGIPALTFRYEETPTWHQSSYVQPKWLTEPKITSLS